MLIFIRYRQSSPSCFFAIPPLSLGHTHKKGHGDSGAMGWIPRRSAACLLVAKFTVPRASSETPHRCSSKISPGPLHARGVHHLLGDDKHPLSIIVTRGEGGGQPHSSMNIRTAGNRNPDEKLVSVCCSEPPTRPNPVTSSPGRRDCRHYLASIGTVESQIHGRDMRAMCQRQNILARERHRCPYLEKRKKKSHARYAPTVPSHCNSAP